MQTTLIANTVIDRSSRIILYTHRHVLWSASLLLLVLQMSCHKYKHTCKFGNYVFFTSGMSKTDLSDCPPTMTTCLSIRCNWSRQVGSCKREKWYRRSRAEFALFVGRCRNLHSCSQSLHWKRADTRWAIFWSYWTSWVSGLLRHSIFIASGKSREGIQFAVPCASYIADLDCVMRAPALGVSCWRQSTFVRMVSGSESVRIQNYSPFRLTDQAVLLLIDSEFPLLNLAYFLFEKYWSSSGCAFGNPSRHLTHIR